MTLVLWVGVGLLGGLASLLRFAVAEVVAWRFAGAFPLGTLAVNLSGSFVLGVIVGAGVGGDALLLAGTAMVGTYTTFSAWMLDTDLLGEDGQTGLAALNLVLSLAAGVGAVLIGRAIGGAL